MLPKLVMRRRTLRTLLLATLLGAATNIAVTAWCVYAATADRSSVDGTWKRDNGLVLLVRHDCGAGKEVCYWGPVADPDNDMRMLIGIHRPLITAPPAWATLHRSHWPAEFFYSSQSRTDVAYGWPWLTFRGGISGITTSALRCRISS